MKDLLYTSPNNNFASWTSTIIYDTQVADYQHLGSLVVSMAVNNNIIICDVTPYTLVDGTKFSEQPASSIFGLAECYTIA